MRLRGGDLNSKRDETGGTFHVGGCDCLFFVYVQMGLRVEGFVNKV